ncbi:MAG: hypothetical protein AB7S26_04855 [Sandaracinaceae bacterium]
MADATPIVTQPFSLDGVLGQPRLQPLPPASYTSNGTIGRVCTMEYPRGQPRPQQYLSQGPTPEQQRAQREAQRKQMNTIGLWMCGVPCGGGALVRLLGGSEDAVESAAEAGFNVLTPTPGTPSAYTYKPF